MDLYKMGTDLPDPYHNKWQPGAVVEGWSSLIWTERYTEAGDFQLKTPEVTETLALIPDGSHVCINESRETMRVESHAINVNEDGVMEATITGRSFETFLENRNVNGDAGIPFPMLQDYKVQEAIAVLIWNSVCNNTDRDQTGGPWGHDPDRYLNQAVSFFDNIVLQKAQSVEDPPDITDLQSVQEWFLANGDAYKYVLDWLRLGELGLRTTRPQNGYAAILGVDAGAPPPTPQGIVSSQPFNETEIDIIMWDIYNGRNRTINPSTVDPLDPVIFRYDAGHIKNPNYLLSRKGYKNFARVISPDGETSVWDGDDGRKPPGYPTVAPIPADPASGIDRYETIINIDASPIADAMKYMRQRGKIELAKRRRQILMDGAISMVTPHVFGSDYNLGDYVTTMGEFTATQTMQVSEYVRSQDKDGFQAFPTLIQKDPDS